ncbi:hypothetical protein L7F22_048641, partial [Adiantum nelumboides]|nr:hypothetical protein [Adiantum nelumboides]
LAQAKDRLGELQSSGAGSADVERETARVFKLEMTLETFQAKVVDDDCSSEVPAPKVPPPNAEISQVHDSSSACGLLMYDEEALGIFILPCKHAYHIHCFANRAGREEKCLAASCCHVIPDNIKESMFIDSGSDTSTGCLMFGYPSKVFTMHLDVHDVEEIQMMDDDVLPIAHEILAKSKLVRDEAELSKSPNPSKPLISIPANEEKSPSKIPCIAEAFAAARKCKVISYSCKKTQSDFRGARGDQNERLDAANWLESAIREGFCGCGWGHQCIKKEELEPLGCNCWRWVKPVGLKGVLKIMSTLQHIGFAHKVRTIKKMILVIQSLAIFPAVQSDEYANLGIVPQEPSVGLRANEDTGGDALGKEGTASGWTRWKDFRMPFPFGMQPDPLMKDMPPLTRLSQKVLVLDMNGVLLRRYPYPDILD